MEGNLIGITVPMAHRDAVLLHAALMGIHVTSLRTNPNLTEVRFTFRTELSRAELEDFVLPLVARDPHPELSRREEDMLDDALAIMEKLIIGD
jgi:hypothetical protein